MPDPAGARPLSSAVASLFVNPSPVASHSRGSRNSHRDDALTSGLEPAGWPRRVFTNSCDSAAHTPEWALIGELFGWIVFHESLLRKSKKETRRGGRNRNQRCPLEHNRMHSRGGCAIFGIFGLTRRTASALPTLQAK